MVRTVHGRGFRFVADVRDSSSTRAPAKRPFARLPDEIALTLDELAIVLFALDVVEGAEITADDRAKVRRAVRLLTRKLWPELGGLLDDDEA
jgi:hypothetical protein